MPATFLAFVTLATSKRCPLSRYGTLFNYKNTQRITILAQNSITKLLSGHKESSTSVSRELEPESEEFARCLW